ncbi:cysteine/serine-rich nuclear protein 2 isoform X1 [Lathamus discolor]|uniref:cysteine/serine-rich nuclear protein 2 isoform X1 n=2 Tax=Lathamus discolor TaxID=678569 RepID=UPI0032B85347
MCFPVPGPFPRGAAPSPKPIPVAIPEERPPRAAGRGWRCGAADEAQVPSLPTGSHASHGQMDAIPSAGIKRKFEDADVGSAGSNSDDEISNSDSADSCDSVNPSSSSGFRPTSILKRQKQLRRKNVRFDQVTVYYFARRQGFTSVPSQGGSSLGMAPRHNSVRSYTLCEFAQEQEVNHREILREHLKEEKLHAKKMKLTKNGTVESEEADGLTLEDVSDDDIDVENVEVDDYFFLQPLPTKRRRALLRASGVHRIDAEEKQELRAIRLSREECGCDCRLYCDPEACACSQAGIKCQVDRMSFPCGCSRDGCGNMAGRIEFNPIRVRTHYLHTIMKLELENKRQGGRPPVPEEAASGAAHGCSSAWLGPQPGETQDFQEFMAENESAVMHLQTAEELERLKAEEDSSSGPGVESLGVCILEEPLAVPQGLCPALAAPILIQAQLPPGSSVLCFAEGSEPAAAGEQPYLNDGSMLYYPVEPRPGSRGDGAPPEPPAPSCVAEKELSVLPGATPGGAASKGEAAKPPPSPPGAAASAGSSVPAEPVPEPALPV